MQQQQQQYQRPQHKPRHHQRQRSRPMSGKPGKAHQQPLILVPQQPGSANLQQQQLLQQQQQHLRSGQQSQHINSAKGFARAEQHQPPSSSQQDNANRYYSHSSTLLSVDSPMQAQSRQIAAFKHHAQGGSRAGGVSQTKSRPHVRGSLSQKRVRRDSADQRGGHHNRRQSQLKTITSINQQDGQDNKMAEIVQTTEMRPVGIGHPPVPAINNNITVNVNLNVTGEDAQLQKQIAQQLVQAATQGLPQQVVTTRQTPFTQFMTDNNVVNQAMTTGLQYIADQPLDTMGTSVVLNATDQATMVQPQYPPHRMQHTVSSSKVSKRSSRQQQTQPMPSNSTIVNRQGSSANQRIPSQYQKSASGENLKRCTMRPASAKRVPSSSTQGGSANATTSLSSLTTQQLTAFGFQASHIPSKLSTDGLAIEGVKKQKTIQQPAKRHQQFGQQQQQFNPDLAYVLEGTQNIQQTHNPGTRDQKAQGASPDLLRSISMSGPSMSSTLNIMNAARSSQNNIKQDDSKVSIVTCNSPESRFSPLGRANNQDLNKSQLVNELQNHNSAEPIQPPQTVLVQQPQPPLMSSFNSQALPIDANHVGLNFRGFSHAGKPVQIKHPGMISEGTDYNMEYSHTMSGEVMQKQPNPASRYSLQSMKIVDQNNQVALIQSVTPSQTIRLIEPVKLKQKSNAVDPAYQDFQRMIQENLQHQHQLQLQQQQMQQQVQSSEAYQQQHGRQQLQLKTQQQQQSSSAVNFNRPGRKVVQRPPSAKQQKLASQKSSQSTKSVAQNQGPLSSQSITLRQRTTPSNHNNLKGSLHSTAQHQHYKAVRNQKDSMALFIDKRGHQQEVQQPSNYIMHVKPLTQTNHSQQQHYAHPQTHLQGHRDLAGLINATGGPHNDHNQYGQVQPQQVGHQPQVPLFIKKNQPSQQSHTLVNELRKQNLMTSGLVPAKQQRSSEQALHATQSKDNGTVSPSRLQDNSWRVDYMQVRDSMSIAQQKLIEENISLMTSIRQDTDVATVSIKVPAKKLENQSSQQPMTAHSMTLQYKKQSNPDISAPVSRLSQHEPTSKALEKSVSQKTIQQKATGSVQTNTFESRHQSTRPTAKIIDSKTLSLNQVQQQALQQYGVAQQPYTIVSTQLSPNKQNMIVLIVPQQSQSSNAQLDAIAPNGSATDVAAVDVKNSTATTNGSVKRPARQARPKSGIPLNRAPFRPSGVAQPQSDIISQQRGHHARGDQMRKSGTIGRTSSAGGDKVSGMEETKQRPASSKYDSNRQNLFPRGRQSPQQKKKKDSYGDQSYGSGDDDGSYYSDYDDEDEKEQLHYDDQKEYNSARVSPDLKHPSRVLQNPPVAKSTIPVDLKAPQAKIEAQKLPNLQQHVNNKTIQVKASSQLEAAAMKIEDRCDTFGTPQKHLKVNREKTASPHNLPIEKVSDMMQDMSGDDEELSVGYLDNDEGAEEEGRFTKPAPVSNNNSRDFLPSISTIPDNKVLISLTSKSPDVRISKRTVKLKVADVAGLGPAQNSTERSNVGLKPQLGISSSAKIIDKHNNYMDQSQSASKKSLQLSDSCPKENLGRRLYQRPGLLSSYDGLNSRLRTMSIRHSNEQESAASQYQLKQGQDQSQKKGKAGNLDSECTLEQEMIIAHSKADNYNETDPYTQKMPVYLCKSPFIGRPPTVFFQYPPGVTEVCKPIERDHIFKMKQNKFKMKFKIAESVHTYNCVVNSLCWNGFTQTDSSGWNLLWSAPLKPETLRNYDMYKHCNHFAGTWQLGRKDLMYRNISAQMREFGDEYNIVPKTWILPYDLRLLQKEREETQGKNLWILKPAASSCGRGIKILSKHSSIPKKGPYVVNQYIMKPHLLGGYKYDLRLYVLITSFEPLTIYLYQDGLVRFATQPYTTKNRKSRFAHLTNFSVNKKASNYKKAGKDDAEENSSKWRLKTLANSFKQQGLNWAEIWQKIHDLVIKAVISVEPTLANNLSRASRNRHLCFEIYGFDVIIDHNMKPWILEVNVLPSLSSSSQLDKKIKTALMTDVFSTIGLIPYNRKKFERAQEHSYWNRFSGLTKRTGGGSTAVTDSVKKQQRSKLDDGQHNYFGSNFDQQNQRDGTGSKNKINSSDVFKNYGNVPMEKKDNDDADSSEGENVAWTQTQNNMAQSQSNYVQGKIRSVKECQATYDFNIEEQLVIVELCEEYCRRGNFELIFPRKSNTEKYKKYFRVQRASNIIVWKWLKLSSIFGTGHDKPPTTTTTKKGNSGSRHHQASGESRNQADAITNSNSIASLRSRFSVLKDFKIRANCANPYIEAIKQI